MFLLFCSRKFVFCNAFVAVEYIVVCASSLCAYSLLHFFGLQRLIAF